MKNYYVVIGYDKMTGELAFQRLPSMPSHFGILITEDKPVDIPPDNLTFPMWIVEEGECRVYMIGQSLKQMPTGENLEEMNSRVLAYLQGDHPNKALFDKYITDDGG